MQEIKTLEERTKNLVALGKEKGFITFEQLADELKGLDIDSDDLDNLYNILVENKIEVVAEADITDEGEDGGQAIKLTDEPIILADEEITKMLILMILFGCI